MEKEGQEKTADKIEQRNIAGTPRRHTARAPLEYRPCLTRAPTEYRPCLSRAPLEYRPCLTRAPLEYRLCLSRAPAANTAPDRSVDNRDVRGTNEVRLKAF